MSGTLFVVATPIGNLDDLTIRARRTLETVDLIAAEDTRRTAKLLAHFEIRKPLVSLREHNEAREAARLIERMRQGQSVALVTDAGTPGIADPGAILVRAAREHDVSIRPIPGPSAVTAALSAAGFDASEFVFLGFAPGRGADRSRWFQELADEPRVVVFFEAPHRIVDCLGQLAEHAAGRAGVMFGELTKVHERATPIGAISQHEWLDSRPKGEFVIVLDRVIPAAREAARAESVNLVGLLTSGVTLSLDEAVRVVAKSTGMSESSVFNAVRKQSILGKRQMTPSA